MIVFGAIGKKPQFLLVCSDVERTTRRRLSVTNRKHRRAKPQTSTLVCPHSLIIRAVA